MREREEILSVASCYRNRDKRWLDGPLGSHADSPFIDIREIKLDVTWSYVKRQTANGKNETFASVFSSLNSRVKIFVLVEISRRHFSICMSFKKD